MRELTISEQATNAATLEHIVQVNKRLHTIIELLMERGLKHDDSKLKDPEVEIFTIYTPKLKSATYGSEEYMAFLKEMHDALDHHYKENNHHPEHYEHGIDDMDLVDLIEMVCDWKAASTRQKNQELDKCLEINKNRFKIGDQLFGILKNTITRYFPDDVEKKFV